VADHSVDLGHCSQFHNTYIITTKTQYMDRNICEATKIDLHLNNMNREVGFCLSKSWKPLICSLKKPRNMTPDLQGYAGQCMNGNLALRLLGQSLHGRPASPHPTQSHSVSCLLPTGPSLQTLPFSSIDFPCSPLSLPSCSYIAGCYSTGDSVCSHLLRLRHIPEDGILHGVS
jgi:hypothetical protein